MSGRVSVVPAQPGWLATYEWHDDETHELRAAPIIAWLVHHEDENATAIAVEADGNTVYFNHDEFRGSFSLRSPA